MHWSDEEESKGGCFVTADPSSIGGVDEDGET